MMACRHVCKMMGSSLNSSEVRNGVKQACVMAPALFCMMFSVMLMDSFRDSAVLMAIYSTLEGCKPKLRYRLIY